MELTATKNTLSLPKGYKQTEVGLIPEDWEVKKLGQLAKVIGGGTPKTTIAEYWNGKINWFTPTEVGKQKYLSTSRRKITAEGLQSSSAQILPIGTILLTTRAGIGDLGILTKEAATNQGFQSLLVFNEFDNEYIYYLLSTLKPKLLSSASGSTFLEISPSKVKSIKAGLPPTLTEQKAIAQVLSDTDALIQALEKKIAKKKSIKKGVMQKLLTPKEDWEVKTLGEVGEIITGGTPPTSIQAYWGGKIPWVTPTDIRAEKNINSSEREITKEGLGVIRKLPPNTLLVTCIASIGKNAILRKAGACNQQINAIVPNDSNNVDFLYYLIENNATYIKGKAGITATLMISKKDFSEITFAFPKNKIEQNQIAQILSDIDKEIEVLEQKIAKYQQLKQGMMQQLLTGKIRLV
jgi:type I restriction enzyme S subunit